MRGVRSASQSMPLVMSPLAPLENKDLQASTDWNGAIGNLENARVVADTLKALVHDAVFLDDDAYTNAQTLTIYQQRLQTQQRRIRELEHEVLATRKEVEKKDDQLRAEVTKTDALQKRNEELQQELDNNTVVFKMHYQELIDRNDEISRLKAVIEGLQSST